MTHLQVSSTPVVSVLMTAYNREQYIAQAIKSVLASTFRDFELIIVDDCSRDKTLEIANSIARQDKRIRVFQNSKNLGDYPNRNRAAELARGKYLKYVDSDDLIYPHGLEIMVQSMEKYPEAALGMCRPPSPSQPYPLQVEPQQAYREHFLGEGFLDAGPSLCIIRSTTFNEVGGFSGKRYVGDTEMWLRLAALYPVVKLPNDLVWWRQHDNQEYRQGHITHTYSIQNFRIAITALTSQHCPLSSSELSQSICKRKYLQARTIWHLALRKRSPRTALQLYNDSGLSSKELFQGLKRFKART